METNIALSAYTELCSAINLNPVTTLNSLEDYIDASLMAEMPVNVRLTKALQVFIPMLKTNKTHIERVDKQLIDHYIAHIDETLNTVLNAVLHHPQFQALESIWRSLQYLISRIDFSANIKVEILDLDKEDLRADFAERRDVTHTHLYKQIYEQEYDTPGGEPISVMISNYEFDASHQDVELMQHIANVAAFAHCPFLGSIGPKFFNKQTMHDVMQIEDLDQFMERADYIRWLAFRDSENARYFGLILPRFLLRLPYGHFNPTTHFCFEEDTTAANASHYLWGNASFAFAANMAHCFKDHGWTVNIRGPEAGGKVQGLPIHQYNIGKGILQKPPTEIIIPETRELALAELGFIPLCYYKNTDFACFFSANSSKRPEIYQSAAATANSRINAKLPYIFLSARIAHHLKVLQRETIGSNITEAQLEHGLNTWLQTLVTKMNNPGPELLATHPLREGYVKVAAAEDNPGFYRVTLHLMPHFQIEGIDVCLSLVSQLPGEDKTTIN